VQVRSGAERGAYGSPAQSAATFGEKPLLDTPFQVNVYTEQLFTDQLARSLNDVTRNDPAVTPSVGVGAGSFDTVNIRGFELNNWSGYRREGLMFANQAQQPLENKERLEVVKGLSALRYGFTNPGGIVNWVLKKPTEQPLARVQATANSFGGAGAHIDLGGRFGQERRFGYRINAAAEHEATFVDGADGPRRMVSGYFDWRLAPGLVAEFETEHQSRELVQQANIGFASFPAGRARVPLDVNPRTLLGQPWGTYPTRMTNSSARLTWSPSPAWTVRTAVQYADLWRDQVAGAIAAGSIRPDGGFNVTTFYSPGQTRKALTSETAVEVRQQLAGLQHEFAFGIATMDHKVGSGPSASPLLGSSSLYRPVTVNAPQIAAPPPYLQSRQREQAVFAADTITFSPAWSAFAGLRHTRPQYDSFGATGARIARYDKSDTTPSAGIVFKPAPNWSTYLSYATGIEQGGTAPAGTANAGEIQNPVRSKQWEIGAKAELARGLAVSGAWFHIDKGLEYVDPAGNRYVQDGRQVHRGLEVSFTGRLARGLRTVGGLMLLDPSVERTANAALVGKRPVNAPRRQASLYLDYDLPHAPGWSVSGGLYHTGARAVDAANTLRVPAFTRLDLGARYATRLLGRDTTLRAYLENAADKRYFSSVSFGSFNFGSPRALRVSLTTEL
jgi:iron complex outermembrane receptor protein